MRCLAIVKTFFYSAKHGVLSHLGCKTAARNRIGDNFAVTTIQYKYDSSFLPIITRNLETITTPTLIAFIRFNLAIMRATIVPLWRLDQ